MIRALPVLLLLAAPTWGHDFWLEADPPRPDLKAKVVIRLHVGDQFATEGEKPLGREGTTSFALWAGGKKDDRFGDLGKPRKPALEVACEKAGTCLVALARAPRLITLEPAKFDSYLKEEGLDDALAERKKRGESAKPGRERYGRSIKLLFRIGDKGDDGWKAVAGLPLEIVPLADPTGLKVGDSLPVRLLEYGKPLAGARVTAYSRHEGKVETRHETTTEKGEATFKIGSSGPWLLRLVRMKRIASKDADWESRWSALSFEAR